MNAHPSPATDPFLREMRRAMFGLAAAVCAKYGAAVVAEVVAGLEAKYPRPLLPDPPAKSGVTPGDSMTVT